MGDYQPKDFQPTGSTVVAQQEFNLLNKEKGSKENPLTH
jgi:hypothetical protein